MFKTSPNYLNYSKIVENENLGIKQIDDNLFSNNKTFIYVMSFCQIKPRTNKLDICKKYMVEINFISNINSSKYFKTSTDAIA